MKSAVAVMAFSAIVATGVEAQETRKSRVVPAAVYDVAPGLG